MKNNRIMTITVGMGLIFAMFVGCGGRTGEKEYNKAMSAWKDGNLVEARTLFDKSIRKMSGNERKSVAWNQLGLVLWKLGETEAAAKAFNESCTLSDTVTEANMNLGIALFHMGRFNEAEVALNNVLGNKPKNETALAMLGLIAAQRRDWNTASSGFAKAAAANPRDPAGRNALILMELQKSRNTETAIQNLKQLLSAYPEYAPAAYNLGVIYDQWLGNRSAAVEWYQNYLRIAGTEGSRVAAAKQSIARLGSQSSTTTTAAYPATAARFMKEGADLYAAKKYAEAVAQYQQAIQADPNMKAAHYNLALAYFALAKNNDAEQSCKNALRIDPRYADARYMLSYIYFQQRKWDDAEREAKELAEVDPKRGTQMLTYISQARK